MSALNFFSRSTACQSTIPFAFVLVLTVCLTSDLSGQGKLGRVREAVRRHDSPPAANDHHHEDDSHDDEHTYHGGHHNRGGHRKHRRGGGASLGSVFLSSPSFNEHCPQRVVHEHIHVVESTPVVGTELNNETYFDQDCSDSMALSSGPFGPSWDSYFETWSGRLSATYGYDFEEITQGYFGLLLQAPGSLGLDTSVMMLRENGATFRDHLWMGDVNVVYEAINASDFRARMGIGINWLGDQYGGEAGVNLTFGFDWQLSSEWILTGESDFGSLGDSDLFRGELSIGRQFGNAEWTSGYRHTDIGGTSLGSIFTGFRFRM